MRTGTPWRCATRDDLVNRVHGAERVRHVRHRDDLRALRQQRLELVEHQLAAIVHRRDAEPSAALLAEQLPRHDVRVVLHRRDEHFVAGPDAAAPEGVRHEIDALGAVAREDDLARARSVEERGDFLPRALVGLARHGTELVHATMHVGVVVGVVVRDRVNHAARLLRRRRIVEIDQRLAVNLPGENREVRPHPRDVQCWKPARSCGDRRHTASISARSRASCV